MKSTRGRCDYDGLLKQKASTGMGSLGACVHVYVRCGVSWLSVCLFGYTVAVVVRCGVVKGDNCLLSPLSRCDCLE